MPVEHLADLQPLNTFGLPGRALYLLRVQRPEQAWETLKQARFSHLPRFILGGGSNTLVTGDMEGLVLKVEVPGLKLVETDASAWIVEAGAGESWQKLVEWTLAQGLPGLENLALIPGTVGAAPVQNIGAYGLELADRFDSLQLLDLADGTIRTLGHGACRFGYRDSIFKSAAAKNWLITRVRLRLPRPWQPVLAYPDLARLTEEKENGRPSPARIFERVCELRRGKLPDPETIGNAGSFFKNPILPAEKFHALQEKEPAIVHWPLPGQRYKLAAAWMIDACGWKGRKHGPVGVHEKQALVLVNYGRATGKEVMALAAAIQDSVLQRFGVLLEPEPTVI